MKHNEYYLSIFAQNMAALQHTMKEKRMTFLANMEANFFISFGKHGFVQTAYANAYRAGELTIEQCLSGFALYLKDGYVKD